MKTKSEYQAFKDIDKYLYDSDSGVRIDWLIDAIKEGLIPNIKWVEKNDSIAKG